MEIRVERRWYSGSTTIGELYIDGSRECYTLEDRVRPAGVKVPGETAIPEGRYRVVIDFSNRFGKLMPHILDVPMFDGIRIHLGNTAEDTEGCILLGNFRDQRNQFITHSRDAFAAFFEKLQCHLVTENEPAWITVENATEGAGSALPCPPRITEAAHA